MWISYRPEDVLLRPADDADSSPDAIRARIKQIDPTVPLARITLASTPSITALTLHRDILLHNLKAGDDVIAALPPHSVRIFPGESLRTQNADASS